MNDIEVLEELKEKFIFSNLSMTREEQKKTAYAIEKLLKERQGHEHKIGELEYKYEKALDDLIKYEKERQSDKEIIKFLDLSARELSRALNKNNLVRNKYEICYLYKE